MERVKEVPIYLALFVDDGLIATKSKQAIEVVLEHLRSEFKITSRNHVGMQIERNHEEKSIFIHQSMYVKSVIKRFGMVDAKIGSMPAEPHTALCPLSEGEKEVGNVPYCEAVGALMFVAIVSRPDIAYAVNSVTKFLNKHGQIHWRAVKRIIAYLKGTSEFGIEFRDGGSKLRVIGYSDEDYASDIETRKSTTGYLLELAGGSVTWSSQRQRIVTLSTTESEYVAAAAAAKEAIWLRKLMRDIGCLSAGATVINVDNQSAIKLVKNPEYHKRTKHIDIRYHYIRKKYNENEF